MKDTTKFRRACGLALLALIAAGFAFIAWRGRNQGEHDQKTIDYTGLSVAESPYLADVVEPITVTFGIIDGNGGVEITFVDSRGTKKRVWLEEDWTEDSLLFFDRPDETAKTPNTQLPRGGREERAFCGLLQRWCRSNPRASEIRQRLESRSPGERIF